jgi:zinc D-Ala-D-Ala carboxypeptidase
MKVGTYFTLAEFTRTAVEADNIPSGGVIANIQELCREVLDPLRALANRPIIITSGYRSTEVNKAIGGASTSQHRLGQAADIKIEGLTPRQIVGMIRNAQLPIDQAIEEFGRWVHVSYGPRHRREYLSTFTDNGKIYYKEFL